MWGSRRLSLYLTVAGVSLAPLPFGSVETIWVATWSILFSAALLSASLEDLRARHALLIAPAAAGLGLIVWGVWLQTSGLAVTGGTNPGWSAVRELLDPYAPVPAAASYHQPWLGLGGPLVAFLSFSCAFVNSLNRDGAYTIFRMVTLAGAAYALFGLGAYLYDPGSVLWVQKIQYQESLTSTFINRNTAATFFGSCAVVAFLSAAHSLEKTLAREGLDLSQWSRVLLNDPPRELLLPFIAALLCLLATALTLSRAGIVVSISVLALCGAIFARRRLSTYARPMMLAALLGISLLLFLELWGGGVAYRIGTQGLIDLARWETYRGTWAMIMDRPVLGTGLGTFESSYPKYRPGETAINYVWDRAHSTGLEFAAEMGLPLTFALGAVWIFYGSVLLRGIATRRRDVIFPIAGLGAGLVGTLHSSIDFSLQIPGYSILFGAVVGCAVAQSVRTARAPA